MRRSIQLLGVSTSPRQAKKQPLLRTKQQPRVVMSKNEKKEFFYAIAKGRRTGVFSSINHNWNADLLPLIDGFPGSKFKKFSDEEDAKRFCQEHNGDGTAAALHQQQQQNSTTSTSSQQVQQRRARDDGGDNGAAAANNNNSSDNGDELRQLFANISAASQQQTTPLAAAAAAAALGPRQQQSFDFGQLSQLTLTAQRVGIVVNNVATPTTTTTSAAAAAAAAAAARGAPQRNEADFRTIGNQKLPVIRAFTDGACPGNGRPDARGGFGFVIRSEADDQNESAAADKFTLRAPLHPNEPQTNNRAEMVASIAVLAAVERADQQIDDLPHGQRKNRAPPVIVDVLSDSAILVDGMGKWLPEWLRKGNLYKMANPDLWRLLLRLIVVRQARLEVFMHAVEPDMPFPLVDRETNPDASAAVQLHKVRGHSADIGNQRADAAAVAGARIAVLGLITQPDNGVWKYETAADYCVAGLRLPNL